MGTCNTGDEGIYLQTDTMIVLRRIHTPRWHGQMKQRWSTLTILLTCACPHCCSHPLWWVNNTHFCCFPFASASAVASSPGHSTPVDMYTALSSLYSIHSQKQNSLLCSSSPLVWKDIVICLHGCSVGLGKAFAIPGKEELCSWLALPGLLC